MLPFNLEEVMNSAVMIDLPLLPGPAGSVWPLPGWLARAGGRRGAHHLRASSRGGPQAPAVPLPTHPAQEAPELELPALVDALAEALGQPDRSRCSDDVV